MGARRARIPTREGVFGGMLLRFYADEYEDQHEYEVRDAATGERLDATGLVSATEYAHSLFPAFDPDAALKKMNATTHAIKYRGMSDEQIKRYWKLNGQHAAELGTAAHAYLETCMCMEISDPGSLFGKDASAYPVPPEPRPEDFSSIGIAGGAPDGLRDASGIAILACSAAEFFGREVSGAGYFPAAAEMMLYDPETRISGTVDAAFVHAETGGIWLVDWKRRLEFEGPNCFSERGAVGTPGMAYYSCRQTLAAFQLNTYRGIVLKTPGEAERISALGIRCDAPVGRGNPPPPRVDRLSIVSVHPNIASRVYATRISQSSAPTDVCSQDLSLYELYDIEPDDSLFAVIAAHRKAVLGL